MLSKYFLQPEGFLGLLALVPLIIFYLIRRKPDRQIMPAMMFFMKDRKSGKAQTALRKLMRNLLLLFHILLVLGFAAALAHPFFEARATAEQTVVVFDKSASMSNDLSEARDFVRSNLGDKNTLVLVDNGVKVAAEEASRREVLNRLKTVETSDTKSDIANGLELASDYRGTVLVASDLDQTVSQKSSDDVIENLRNSDRTVKVMNVEEENSWGIINVHPGKQNSTLDVKNFMNEDADIQLTTGDSSRRVSVGAGAVESFTVPTDTGRNTVELEEDGFSPDNTAYISVPEDKSYKVVFITEGNSYFRKVVELIEFTSIEVVEPPVEQDLDADVYVIGQTNRVLTDTVEKIEQDVRKGSSMVVFSHPGVFNLEFESLPVEQKEGGYQNTSVNIREPQQISLGKIPVLNAGKIGGESYATPDHAMVRAGYGDGEVFFYNIRDGEFRTNFLYPVFWKHVLQDLVDRPSVQELNLETGDNLESAGSITTPDGDQLSGEIQVKSTGFYKSGDRIYAANLESEDESYAENVRVDRSNSGSEIEKRDIQNLAALLLGLLVLGELGYLRHIGEI